MFPLIMWEIQATGREFVETTPVNEPGKGKGSEEGGKQTGQKDRRKESPIE